jgi:hypothetical protein
MNKQTRQLLCEIAESHGNGYGCFVSNQGLSDGDLELSSNPDRDWCIAFVKNVFEAGRELGGRETKLRIRRKLGL